MAKTILAHRSLLVERWFESHLEALRTFPNDYAESADPAEVRSGWLRPMLDILAEFAKTGDALYLALYRDKRRRYAPHREGTEALAAYFRLVLPNDEEALLALAGTHRTEASAWLARVHAPLVQPSAGTTIRILTIGDCLLSEVQSFLHPLGLEMGMELDFRYYYFSARQGADIVQDGIAGALEKDKIDLVAASYLSYQGIPLYRSLLADAGRMDAAERKELIDGIIGFMRSHLHQIRELTDAPIVLHNASGLPLTRWRRRVPLLPALSPGRRRALDELNAAVALLARETENCVLLDEVAVTAAHGLRECSREILPARIGRGAQIHPAWFGRHLAVRYAAILRDFARFKKTKVLAVDFDNTLWKGVMADGPVEHYLDRQHLLKRLQEQGIVLVAVSKNDPANIRWSEMAIAAEDFAALKISWQPKPQSIKELAEELNLGLDSFVLIDDNPAERELVRLEVPKVELVDADVAAEWESLALLFEMPNTRQTEEARRRTALYREQAARSVVVRSETDYPALMAKLELRASIRPAARADLERVTELVQRTNQFNTTTIRYTRSEIERMIRSGSHDVLVGQLADKFGDLGVVAVAIVEREGGTATIQNFVMSCRAMGFGMEFAMLSRAVRQTSAMRVIGRFVPSGRNEPASAFYSGAGFREESPGHWVLEGGPEPQGPPWIRVA